MTAAKDWKWLEKVESTIQLHERDIDDVGRLAPKLRAAWEALETAKPILWECRDTGRAAIEVLRKHDYVFRRFPRDMKANPPQNEDERWEALAFSFYTDIAALASHAEQALKEEPHANT